MSGSYLPWSHEWLMRVHASRWAFERNLYFLWGTLSLDMGRPPESGITTSGGLLRTSHFHSLNLPDILMGEIVTKPAVFSSSMAALMAAADSEPEELAWMSL